MSKQEHPYAHVLRWIADGETVERQVIPYPENRWHVLSADEVLEYIGGGACGQDASRFRLKPRTITINGHEVPEPMRVAPQRASTYYLAAWLHEEAVEHFSWTSAKADQQWLARGLCHTTREAAEAHAKALLSFTTTEQP